MFNIFKKLTCKHKEYKFVTNFYGDAINTVSTRNKIYRSLWQCKECGKSQYREELNKDMEHVVNFRDYKKEYGWLYKIFEKED